MPLKFDLEGALAEPASGLKFDIELALSPSVGRTPPQDQPLESDLAGIVQPRQELRQKPIGERIAGMRPAPAEIRNSPSTIYKADNPVLNAALGVPRALVHGAEQAIQAGAGFTGNEQARKASERRVQGLMLESDLPDLEQGAGSMLAIAPAALINPAFGAAVGGGLAAGPAIGEGMEAGLSTPEAIAYGVGQGGLEYLTERIPIGILFGKGGAHVAERLVKAFFPEATGEQIATLTQDALRQSVIEPNKPWSEYWAERGEAAKRTLIATAGGLGAAGAIQAGVQRLVPQTNQFADVLDEVVRGTTLKPVGHDIVQDLYDRGRTRFANVPVQPQPELNVPGSASTLAQQPIQAAPLTAQGQATMPDEYAGPGGYAIPQGEADALQEQIPAEVDVREQARDGEEVAIGDAEVQAPAEEGRPQEVAFDVSGRTNEQLAWLAEHGKPGWREAAIAESARRKTASLPAESAAPKFLDALSSLGNYDAQSKTLTKDGVTIQFATPNQGKVAIFDFKSGDKGRGNGARVLKEITSLADATGVDLELSATPIDEMGYAVTEPASVQRLVDFYRRNGFISRPGTSTFMDRKPNTGAPIATQPSQPAQKESQAQGAEGKTVEVGQQANAKPDEVSAFDQRYPTIAAAEQAIKAKKLKQVAVFADGDKFRIGAKVSNKQAPSNNLIQRIKQLGGINTRYRSDVIGDKAGAPGLFSGNGKGLDDLATMLQAEGFAIDTDEAGGGVDDLTELIQRAVNSGETVLNYAGQQAAAEKKLADDYRDQLKEEIAKLGGNPARNATTKQLIEMRENLRAVAQQKTIEAAAQIETLIGKELTDADWDAILNAPLPSVDQYAADLDQAAFMQREQEENDAAYRRNEEETQVAAGQAATRGARQGAETGRAEPGNQEAQESREDFGLTGETPEEIRAREEAQAAKEKAESDRAKADEQPFVMTGSNRAADEAEARGQTPMFSKAHVETEPRRVGVGMPTGKGMTVESAISHLRKRFGKRIDKMLESSTLKIVATPAQLPAWGKGQRGIGGAWDGTTAWIVASQASPETLAATYLHEVGEHAGMQEMLGNKYHDVITRLDDLIWDGDETANRAASRVPKDTPAKDVQHERLAYFIEEAQRARDAQPQTFSTKARQLLQDILAAIRAWAYRKFGGITLTEADILALAKQSARRVADRAGQAQGQTTAEAMLQKVWHGTPHIWAPEPGFPHGRPRLDKMGTGEGTQAYGWGWYSAETKEVAGSYIVPPGGKGFSVDGKTYGEWQNVWHDQDKPTRRALTALADSQGNATEALVNLRAQMSPDSVSAAEVLAGWIDQGKITKPEPGSLYQLDIPDEVLPHLLDWYATLEDQPKQVRDALQETDYWKYAERRLEAKADRRGENYTGADIYRDLLDDYTPQEASEYLASLGIVGNRYLDGQSRKDGDGTYNYVIWDQPTLDKIALLERNGEKLDAMREAEVQMSRTGTINVDGVERPTTNSNGQQIAQTEEGLRNFWRWFGDSKVVDNQGRPLVVYHGSPDLRFLKDDATFKSQSEQLGGMGRKEHAHWFTTDLRTAKTYADPRRAFDYQNAEEGVVAAYIRLEKPLEVDAAGKEWRSAQARGKTSDVIAQARDEGRDGVRIKNVKDEYNNTLGTKNTTTFTVFDPTQIKSATGNRGTFDPANPDIRFSKEPQSTDAEEMAKKFGFAIKGMADARIQPSAERAYIENQEMFERMKRGVVSNADSKAAGEALAAEVGWSPDSVDAFMKEAAQKGTPPVDILAAMFAMSRMQSIKLLEAQNPTQFIEYTMDVLRTLMATRAYGSEMGRALQFIGAMERMGGYTAADVTGEGGSLPRGQIDAPGASTIAIDKDVSRQAADLAKEVVETGEFNETLRKTADAKMSEAEMEAEVKQLEADLAKADKALSDARKAREAARQRRTEARQSLKHANDLTKSAQESTAKHQANTVPAADIQAAEDAMRVAQAEREKAWAALVKARQTLMKAKKMREKAQGKTKAMTGKEQTAKQKTISNIAAALTEENLRNALGGDKGIQKIMAAMHKQGKDVDLGMLVSYLSGMVDSIAKEQSENRSTLNKLMAMHVELWRANILTGLFTHEVNVTSNAANMLIEFGLVNPIQEMLPGGIGLGGYLDALKSMGGYRKVLADIWALMKYNAFEEAPAARLSHLLDQRDPELLALMRGTEGSKWADSRRKFIPTLAGKVIRGAGFVPLGIEDAIFKVIPFRYELARQQAAGEQRNVTAAIDAANKLTFQDSTGMLGMVVAKMHEKAPYSEFWITFVKTMTNLIKRSFDLTPGLSQAKNWDALIGKEGDKARREAIALSIVGVGIASMVMALMGDDDDEVQLSGFAPYDRLKKLLWLEEHDNIGLRIGDEVYPFYRMSPLAEPAGLTIGAYNSIKQGDAGPLFNAMYQSIVTKHFMAKIADLIDGIEEVARAEGNEKSEAGERLVRRQLGGIATGTMIPNFIAQLGDMTDAEKREVNTIMQDLQKKIPVLRESLPSKLKVTGEVMGEPRYMSPFPVQGRPVKKDEVTRWLLKLGRGIDPNPKSIKDLPHDVRQTLLRERWEFLGYAYEASKDLDAETQEKSIRKMLSAWTENAKAARVMHELETPAD